MPKLYIAFIILTGAIFLILNGAYLQICMIFIVLLCILKGKKQQSLVNPYYLLIPTCISYLLYTSKMGHVILMPLSNSTHILIILCISAIFISFVLADNLKIHPVKKTTYNENFFLIMIIGLIPTVVSVLIYGNPLGMEGEEALEAKQNFTIPIIGQLQYFLQASIIVACKNNNSKQIIFSFLISLFVAVISLTKTAMLVTVLFTLIGFLKFKPRILYSKKIKILRKYAYIIVPALLIFGFIFNNTFRRVAQSSNLDYVESLRPEILSDKSELSQNMYLNYLYYCSPWGNLQYNISYNHSHSNGNNSFAQFAKKLGITLEPAEKIQPSFLNTHSFITDFYLDFGYFGSILASFILGYIIFFSYRKYGLSNDPLLLSFYALISYATVMLFFSNHFIIGYLLNYYITFGGFYLIMHKFRIV